MEFFQRFSNEGFDFFVKLFSKDIEAIIEVLLLFLYVIARMKSEINVVFMFAVHFCFILL